LQALGFGTLAPLLQVTMDPCDFPDPRPDAHVATGNSTIAKAAHNASAKPAVDIALIAEPSTEDALISWISCF
jgi:hypothetical protein